MTAVITPYIYKAFFSYEGSFFFDAINDVTIHFNVMKTSITYVFKMKKEYLQSKLFLFCKNHLILVFK